MQQPRLSYLFEARFKDGTTYFQPPTDVSVEHPLTRSAFYDVVQRLSEVDVFTLRGCGRVHSVHLIDGHFVTDDQILHSPHGQLTNYRLIYFRRMQVVSVGGQHKRPEVIAYFIGWQANDERGKNYQMMLEIPGDGSYKPAEVGY